ncbi:MAG TPA: glycine zipper 2TM domain-containing protein [Gammaproteobacteria bacterium]|nr:glycine zipper 2TM domain-containing protein [Gammaproteobacteria bacterium]
MCKFKITTVSIMAVMAAAVSSAAFATHDGYTDYARVVAAQPVYERVAHSIPHEECRVEQVRYEYPADSRPSATGTLFGTMLGAAVGHQIGHDKDGKRVGRVAGALLGASIGHDISRRSAAPSRVEYREEERCDTSYSTQYEHEVVGYDVTYVYNGKMYHTRMDRDPGSEIKVAVDVRPYAY